MPFGWAKPSVTPPSCGYERAILNEISMLLDYIAGNPAKTLRDLKVASDPARPGVAMPAQDVLSSLTTIESRLNSGTDPKTRGADSSSLLLIRDALNALINPASGLTVAYTAMVVGNRRGAAVRSRAVLAQQAYAGLRVGARMHRWGQRVLLGIALLITVVAIWDSAQVALGKSLLHNLQDLRVKQGDIFREAVRLEESLAQSNASVLPLLQLIGDGAPPAGAVRLTVRLCDRPKLLAAVLAKTASARQLLQDAAAEGSVFESAAQQDICDRDKQLADSFFLAHAAINAYAADWPALAGAGFNLVATGVRMLGSLGQGLCNYVGLSCASHPDPIATLTKNDPAHADSELLIAPVLIVLGNYVLPVIFAVLGAAAFVILDFYSKLRDSLLAPRDHVLSWIRLVLGSVIGACIGLFFSSYGPQAPGPQADMIGVLTLTASGVSFLAGFGVEGVFAMLGTVVKRVFGGESA